MRSYHQFQKRRTEVLIRRRTEHLQDIMRDASGKWSYQGDWMACTLPEEARRRVTAALWCLLAGAAVCCLISGCIRATGMEGCFYVLIPYASCVFAAYFCIRCLAGVSAGKGRLEEYRYRKHMRRLGPCAVWGFVSGLLCVIGRTGEAVFAGGLALHGVEGSLRGGILFMAFQTAAAVLFLAAWHLQRGMKWKNIGAQEAQTV